MEASGLNSWASQGRVGYFYSGVELYSYIYNTGRSTGTLVNIYSTV